MSHEPDTIRLHQNAGRVALLASESGTYVSEVLYLSPGLARHTARGLLAFADGADSGADLPTTHATAGHVGPARAPVPVTFTEQEKGAILAGLALLERDSRNATISESTYDTLTRGRTVEPLQVPATQRIRDLLG